MRETRKFLCVSCPVGCALSVEADGARVFSVSGNQCPLGEKYAHSEVANPVRVFTSTVRTACARLPVCPVRSNVPIPLPKMAAVSREVAKITITAPVRIGQVVIENVCGTGADIVASREMAAWGQSMER